MKTPLVLVEAGMSHSSIFLTFSLFYVIYLKNPTDNFVGAQLKHRTIK